MLASIIIRTYNEEKYLDRLIVSIKQQKSDLVDFEIVIIDSGSTDKTVSIAKKHDCRITYIKKTDFTFGKSLNMGCEYANGDILVFVSGHCIPINDNWLNALCLPIVRNGIDYCYGKQQGQGETKYSEYRHFDKWFPNYSKLPQNNFFCNNANAAVTRLAWQKFKFDEKLTGLEDMFLAKKIMETGGKIGYAHESSVFHIHDESWRQVRIRYEREAYALVRIMPEIHFTPYDFIRYFTHSLVNDLSASFRDHVFLKKFKEILLFRFNQYWGTYKGNHIVRKLSARRKHRYFYPKDLDKDIYNEKQDNCIIANEGK